ncbi:MAG: hypothetical protein J6K88_00310 [Oscillospiraceae bacterium]|nr:hypothetical protein [Oscillospiraceae bacterium]
MIKTGIDEIPNLYGLKMSINKKQSSSQYLADLLKIRKAYVQDVKENYFANIISNPMENVKEISDKRSVRDAIYIDAVNRDAILKTISKNKKTNKDVVKLVTLVSIPIKSGEALALIEINTLKDSGEVMSFTILWLLSLTIKNYLRNFFVKYNTEIKYKKKHSRKITPSCISDLALSRKVFPTIVYPILPKTSRVMMILSSLIGHHISIPT